jgi:hypothetical protein
MNEVEHLKICLRGELCMLTELLLIVFIQMNPVWKYLVVNHLVKVIASNDLFDLISAELKSTKNENQKYFA